MNGWVYDMEFFKNFKTKKQLKKENEYLKAMLMRPRPVQYVEPNIQKYSACIEIGRHMCVPAEMIKREVMRRLMSECPEDFIEWDTVNTPFGKEIKGTIYLTKRGGK